MIVHADLARIKPRVRKRPALLPLEPDRADLVTYCEALARLDRHVVDLAIGYGRHYTDSRNGPYWLADDLDDLLGLIAIEAGVCP